MKVNLKMKGSTEYANYIKPNKELYSSFQKEIQKEVKNLQVEKKKLKRLLQVTQTSASSFIVAIPVSAQTATNTVKDLPSPAELMQISQWAIEYATISIIGIGIVWIVVTRVLHFPAIEKYKKMALEIATNTIKGITEALLIPTIVGIIIGIAFLLFGGMPVFNLPL